MDTGTANLDELCARLTSQRRATIRAVLGPLTDGSAPLLAASVVVGPNPLGSEERMWIYRPVTFVSSTVTARRLATLFNPGEVRTLRVASATIRAQFPETAFSWERKPSLAQYDELSLAWPSVIYTPHVMNAPHVNVPGYLVGDDQAPSFPTFGAAFNAFMYNKFAISGSSSGNPSGFGEVSVRFVDQRAHIRRVRIRPASLDVWIGGRSLDDCRLELNGVEYRQVSQVSKSSRITIPLSEGLPSDAWLWLKHGTDWLDYRALNHWGNYRSADVEEHLPRDLGAEISRLVTQGEGQNLEYKSKLPVSPAEKRVVFKTVVAFASRGGGTVLFGVGDGGEITGLTETLKDARARLTDLLRDLVSPSPQTDIEELRYEGKNILILRVQSGGGIIYALTVDKNKPEYYVRRDGTTFFAQPDEIAAIVRQGDTVRAPWLGYG